MSRPNVIVCLCDQLRAFEVGCYGNDTIRTPHIDRLAKEGVRFDLAVSNNPVCMPARSALLTGQYSRTCMGMLNNFTEGGDKPFNIPEYPADNRDWLRDSTLPEAFKTQGYETALFGKWHVQPAPNLVGFDYALFPRVHHRHTGQTFVENTGQGDIVDGFSIEFEAERVNEYLAQDREDPFFMYYNISPPHMPLADAPEKYLAMYDPDEVPLRPNTLVDGQLAYDENWFKIYLWDFLYYQEHLPHAEKLPDGFDLRHLTALYYGLTTWVDDTVGRLMANLEAHGLAEDTIVVFASDHGDNLGSHHAFNKGLLIEESIRVPLIFWGGLEPQANTAQVAQLIDIMPTLLEQCGAEVPDTVQGRALGPILRGERETLDKNGAFIETSQGAIGLRTPDHLYGMQLEKDLRTISDDGKCLYDLNADPYELHNLMGSADSGLESELRQRLQTWNAQTPWLGDQNAG
ncbi:MAG: sulfatase-like hydrolase/transferase [Candidatus Latescibacterota bacterium]|nr:sulfatase-like hydrolase/transferase [Candidatus Latescibacterota bacterium]